MIRTAILALTIGGLMPCVAATGARAADVERWTATSTTAMAITGDVALRPGSITFANGRSLPIARVRNVDFTDESGHVVPASIYRVMRPANPAMLNGNRICGNDKITFLAIWHAAPLSPGDASRREIAAYTGAAEPAPNLQSTCATFGYEPRR